jgi:hypothetical protein
VNDAHDKLPLIDAALKEPTIDQQTLLGVACTDPSSILRARFRKKQLDKLVSSSSGSGNTNKQQQLDADPSKIYTFEFLQHMFNFQDFSLEAVGMTIPLAPVLNGQPLQIMACHGTQSIWGFDLWHENLLHTE